MTQETVGYVELEWTCRHCGTRNAGTKQTCGGCGAPMSDSQKFDMPGQQTLITDKELIAKGEAGPDIHCPYCGTRNKADAAKCSHCSGDLTSAEARAKGEVLGAFSSAPQPEVKCRYCGTLNSAATVKCKNCGSALALEQKPVAVAAAKPAGKLGILPLVIIGIVIVGCIAMFALTSQTTDTVGVVNGLTWQRRINILEQRPVQKEDWRDRVPAGASLGNCREEVRRTQDDPAPRSQKVCGTPYTLDQGTGVGKVVQDCRYNVLDDMCQYSVNEWIIVDAVVAEGSDANPQWPNPQLNTARRLGNREETYRVTFSANDKTYVLTPRDQAEFAQFVPGSRWTLKVNALGSITSYTPAQ